MPHPDVPEKREGKANVVGRHARGFRRAACKASACTAGRVVGAGVPSETRRPRAGEARPGHAHSAGACGALAAPSAFGCALGLALPRGGAELGAAAGGAREPPAWGTFF